MIIGIHGLNNKPPRPVLQDWWIRSLREGLGESILLDAATEFEMVYWADLLYKFELHTDDNFIFDQLYDLQPYHPSGMGGVMRNHEKIKRQLKAWVSDMLGGSLERWGNSEKILRLADWAVGKLARDLNYYDDPDVKILNRDGTQKESASTVLRNELKETLLKHKGQKNMLIAHSMGSIIAFDVLTEMEQAGDRDLVDTFVTVGSPLSLPSVKARIQMEWDLDALQIPTTIGSRWVNLFDPADAISMDREFSRNYVPSTAGIGIEDIRVKNDYISPEGEVNKHKIYGYLRTPEVAELIKDFLT